MNRRSVFCLSIGIAIGGALPVLAQTQRVARVGVLGNFPPSHPREAAGWEGWQALSDEMKRLGWEEGRNLLIERRFGMNDPKKYLANAEELVASRVDVIYAPGPTAAAAAYQATKAIPIVMHGPAAVELGYAKSLAKPDGNVTGAIYQALDFTGKEFALLKALRPDLKKIGVTTSLGNNSTDLKFKDWQATAGGHGVAVVQLPDTLAMADVEPMLAAAKREGVQALVLRRSLLLGAGLQQINDWAIENKVVIYAGNWARGEVLVVYGPNIPDITRIAIGKIDSILRGAKPGDLPIEQPTRFELVINQKLAKAMGLTIPQSVLLSATEVIQ